MKWNQNETAEFGMQNSDCGIEADCATHIPHSTIRNPHSAFTLVELLVVITIIGILAGLITGAAINALNRAKQTSITLEIQQLDMAMADFKNEYGAYPPNGMHDGTTAIKNLVENDFVRMFKKAFPRNQESPILIQALAGTNTAGAANENLFEGMTAAEAMVFWLGGFSKDPQFPISGPGGPAFDTTLTQGEVLEDRNHRYEFDLGRLKPRNSNGAFHAESNGGVGRVIVYDNPLSTGGPRRQINFWQYAPNGSQLPLVYIDVSRHEPEEYDMPALGDPTLGNPMVYAIEKLREGFSGTPDHGDLMFVNQGKFQILHAGIDDAWGNFGPLSLLGQGHDEEAVITFPEGPFIGDIADTVGNFGKGTLEDAQE